MPVSDVLFCYHFCALRQIQALCVKSPWATVKWCQILAERCWQLPGKFLDSCSISVTYVHFCSNTVLARGKIVDLADSCSCIYHLWLWHLWRRWCVNEPKWRRDERWSRLLGNILLYARTWRHNTRDGLPVFYWPWFTLVVICIGHKCTNISNLYT